MAETATEKKRKSVAFSEGATIVDENGEVMQMTNCGNKTTAESHSNAGVEEVTDIFKDMLKKKKKKPAKKDADADGDNADGEKADAGDELDISGLKKKKKKKKPTAADFEAKLAEVGESGEGGEEKTEPEPLEEGDMLMGTGIWEHDNTPVIPYPQLLSRFYIGLHDRHPDLASSGGKSYKIPPPQCLREGNKKTIFANISEICKRLKRSDEHVTQFLFAELGTNGSVDGSRRLVIKGKFQSKQIENILRRYIVEYVTCKTCKSPDTELSKGENRLYFVTCNSCGSRRSVQAIRTGFSAQIGKRKRQQG